MNLKDPEDFEQRRNTIRLIFLKVALVAGLSVKRRRVKNKLGGPLGGYCHSLGKSDGSLIKEFSSGWILRCFFKLDVENITCHIRNGAEIKIEPNLF